MSAVKWLEGNISLQNSYNDRPTDDNKRGRTEAARTMLNKRMEAEQLTFSGAILFSTLLFVLLLRYTWLGLGWQSPPPCREESNCGVQLNNIQAGQTRSEEVSRWKLFNRKIQF